MSTTTIASLVVGSLSTSHEKHDVSFELHEIRSHEGQLQRHREIIVSWYSAVLLSSGQLLSPSSASAQEAYLNDLISLADTAPVTEAQFTSGTKAHQESQPLDDAANTILELAKAFTQASVSKQTFSKWFADATTGTANVTELLKETASCREQGVRLKTDHLPEANLNLWSVFLTLKLISMTIAVNSSAVSDTIAMALWQVLQMSLAQLGTSLTSMSAESLVTRGYHTSSTANQHHVLQLPEIAAATVRLVLPLMRLNLQQDMVYIGNYCCVLRCLLQPAWGALAKAAKVELIASGGLPLLLAALSQNQDSAFEVSHVITLLLSNHAKLPEIPEADLKLDLEVGMCLFRMGGTARLSQLLRPLEDSSCSSMEPSVVAAFGPSIWKKPSHHLMLHEPSTQRTRLIIVSKLISDIAACAVQPASKADSSSADVWAITSQSNLSTIVTIASRVVVALKCAVRSASHREALETTMTNDDGAECSLVDTLLGLLFQLLAGHLDMTLKMEPLFNNGLLDTVMGAYLVLKQEQRKAGSKSTNPILDSAVQSLLSSAILRVQQFCLIEHLEPVAPETLAWIQSATQSIMACPGFWAEATAASGAIFAALDFAHAAISSDSMQELCKSHRQEWYEALHEVIVQSGWEGQLKALAVLGQLCKAEWQVAPDDAVTSTYYCHKALQDKTFRLFVKAFHDAVQSPEPWTLQCAVSAEMAIQVCSELPPQLLHSLAEDTAEILAVSSILATKLSEMGPRIGANATYRLLRATTNLLKDLPGGKIIAFHQATQEAMMDLFTVYGKPLRASDVLEVVVRLQLLLVECLMSHDLPTDVRRFFQQLGFPMAAGCLCTQVLRLKPFGPDYIAAEYHVIPDAFLDMLAQYKTLQAEGVSVQPPVQAACSVLTHLFLVVTCLAQNLRNLSQLRLLVRENNMAFASFGAPGIARPSLQELKALIAKGINQSEKLKSQMKSLVDFFGVVAADAAWVEGLTQLGSEAWCLNATDPHKLAKDLIYLSNAKALPVATLHGIQAAFAQTQASEASWEAAGQHLLEEEQQAATKAAAKKAKKLRQKLNRQQAQRAATGSPLHLSSDAEPSAVQTDALNHAVKTVIVATEASADDAPHTAAQVPDSTAHSSVQSLAQPSSNAPQNADQAQRQPGQQSDSLIHETDNAEEDDHSFLHDLIQCPITKVTMTDCVIAADGLSYERAAITSWLQHSNASPVTGKPLLHQRLVPNILLRNVIKTHIDSQGEAKSVE